MSTPRKRWFKVADSILREDWDDATLATVTRLMAWLNQRRARDGVDDSEAGEALIGEHDAMAITRVRRPHVALQRLAELPLVAGLTSASASLEQCYSGSAVRLKWTKYAIYQKSNTRDSDKKSPTAGSSVSDLRSPVSVSVLEEKKKAPAAPVADEKISATGPPADQAPDPVSELPPEVVQFAENFRAAVLAANPGREPPSPAAFRGTWCRDTRLLLAKRGERDSSELARWLFSGTGSNADFWRGVVFCPGKFREKYDQLKKAKERDERPPQRSQGGRIGPLEAIARIRARREVARQQDG